MSLTDSDDFTVSDTPENFSDVTILKDDDAFALLRPVSPSAQSALHASVNAVIRNIGGNPAFDHYHQFIYAERGTARASSVFTENTSVEEHNTDSVSQQWNGTSRSHSRSDNLNVDILLAPPTNTRAQLGVAGNHARLYLHKESYRMVLQARHTVTVGKSGKIIRNSQPQVINDEDLILIGNCTYAFEYTSHFRSVEFEAELTHAFAQGSYGQVTAGWAHDGAAVAIKYFKNPRKSAIESHKEPMQIIGKHDNILRLLDCITNFQTSVLTAHCIYSPLVFMTLKDVISSYETNSAAQLALLKDYITGLSHLHDKGIMHRDIKPENLAIRSIQDPIGVILDLDAATTLKSSTDHTKGTVPYLAPEIIALKDWSPSDGPVPQSYEKRIGLWTLGLSMYALMAPCHWSWRYFPIINDINPDRYSRPKYNLFRQQTQEMVDNAKKLGPGRDPTRGKLGELVLGLAERLPKARLSASEILQSAQTATASITMDIRITRKQPGKRKHDQ